jgi:hypothetical protein
LLPKQRHFTPQVHSTLPLPDNKAPLSVFPSPRLPISGVRR